MLDNVLPDWPQPGTDPIFYRSKIKIENGRIHGIKPRDTPANPDSNELWDGDFVITMDGELRIGRGHAHLSEEAAEIRGAGEIRLNSEGKIVAINNNSGHYLPDLTAKEIIEQFFIRKGLWE